MFIARHCLMAGKWFLLLISPAIAFLLLSGSVGAEDITGTWSGVAIFKDRQGSMTLTIRRQDQGYAAEYRGIPSFSGPLLNVRVAPGKIAGTTTFTGVSKSIALSSGNNARLRFYLSKEVSKPSLMGIKRLDRDFGEDMNFQVLLEQRPCCYPGCILRQGCPQK
jgi:hypothetical protein